MVSGGPGGGYVDGDPAADMLDGHFGGAPPIDPFPAPGGALVMTGDATYVADDDFNTLARNGVADVGAYLFDPNGNPGWPLAPEFKDFPNGGGEETGGGYYGNNSGEMPLLTLPSSKAQVRLALYEYWNAVPGYDGTRRGTRPDVHVETTAEKLLRGVDEPLDAALRLAAADGS